MSVWWPGSSAARAVKRADQEKELREALEEQAALRGELATVIDEYEALLERCGAAAIVLDSEGVILRSNEEAHSLIGVRGAALSGLNLVVATLSEELNDLFKEARQLGSAIRREVRGSASGSMLDVEVSPIGGQRAAPHFLLIAHDITARRRLETMRRDFVANVSHELRTPLASIRAMAETLQDGALEDPEVSGKFLATIITETDRLARIAEDLLVLSDAESHQPEKDAIDLSELATLVVTRLRPQAEKAGLKMTEAIQSGLTVEANKDQIEQVLVNLVDNAIKYSSEGGTVTVSAAPEGDFVAVSVQDTGIGIMSQDLPRIFERFYRVDKARSRQSGGTGLGLSIVRHIVESHGGSVTVDSEYNRGSTFTMRLPAGSRS